MIRLLMHMGGVEAQMHARHGYAEKSFRSIARVNSVMFLKEYWNFGLC